MTKRKKASLASICTSALRQTNRLDSLVQVYQDLENTLRTLKVTQPGVDFVDRRLKQINVSKLVHRLARSKHHIERKILKGLATEKAILRKRLRVFVGIRKELKRLPLQ